MSFHRFLLLGLCFIGCEEPEQEGSSLSLWPGRSEHMLGAEVELTGMLTRWSKDADVAVTVWPAGILSEPYLEGVSTQTFEEDIRVDGESTPAQVMVFQARGDVEQLLPIRTACLQNEGTAIVALSSDRWTKQVLVRCTSEGTAKTEVVASDLRVVSSRDGVRTVTQAAGAAFNAVRQTSALEAVKITEACEVWTTEAFVSGLLSPLTVSTDEQEIRFEVVDGVMSSTGAVAGPMFGQGRTLRLSSDDGGYELDLPAPRFPAPADTTLEFAHRGSSDGDGGVELLGFVPGPLPETSRVRVLAEWAFDDGFAGLDCSWAVQDLPRDADGVEIRHFLGARPELFAGQGDILLQSAILGLVEVDEVTDAAHGVPMDIYAGEMLRFDYPSALDLWADF